MLGCCLYPWGITQLSTHLSLAGGRRVQVKPVESEFERAWVVFGWGTTCFSNPRLASGVKRPQTSQGPTEAGREAFARQVCRKVFGFEMNRAQSKRSSWFKSMAGLGTLVSVSATQPKARTSNISTGAGKNLNKGQNRKVWKCLQCLNATRIKMKDMGIVCKWLHLQTEETERLAVVNFN